VVEGRGWAADLGSEGTVFSSSPSGWSRIKPLGKEVKKRGEEGTCFTVREKEKRAHGGEQAGEGDSTIGPELE